ncbi:MAG: hypothetical protein QM689_00340 [Oscillospiraceae bacterium]
MLRCELKKLFIKRKILLLFLVTLVLEGLFAMRVKQVDLDLDAEQYKLYNSQLTHYAGRITEQTTQEITQLYLDASGAQTKLEALSEQLADGEITQEQYYTQFAALNQTLDTQPAAQALYDAYSAAYENPDNVWLMPENAWKLFFETSSADWLLLFFILIVCTAAVKTETDCSMNLYNHTSKNGRLRLTATKLTAVVLTVFVLSAAVSLLRMGILSVRYGTQGMDFPLASVEKFRFSDTALSVGAGFAAVILLKAFGYVYAAAVALLLISLLQTVPAATCMAGITMLPEFIAARAGDGSAIYRYYLPVGLMKSVGFLQGNSPEQAALLFKALTDGQKRGILAVSLAVTIGCLLFAAVKGAGIRLRLRKKPTKLALFMLPFLLLSACSPRENIDAVFADNTDGRYIFVMDQIYDKELKTVIPIAQTPFHTYQVLGLYGENALVADEMLNGETVSCTQYKLINLNDYTETVLFTNGDYCDFGGMLDIEQIYPNVISLFTDAERLTGNQIAFDENNLYFIGEKQVDAVELHTGKERVFLEDAGASAIQYAAGALYYIDRGNFLMRYTVATGETEKIYDRPTARFKALSGSVLVVPFASENCILLSADATTRQLEFHLPDVAQETEPNLIAFSGMTVTIVNKQSGAVTTFSTQAFPIAADSTTIYAKEITEDAEFVVLYDYAGNEISRCAV